MRQLSSFVAVCLFSSLLAAQTSSSSGSNLASKFLYGSGGFETESLQAGRINSQNGMVTGLAGTRFPGSLFESNLLQVVADPQGRFIYTLNLAAFEGGTQFADSGIGGFAVNQQTGALSVVPGSPLIFSQNNFNQMAVDGTGHFLIEPNVAGARGISTGFDVYSIDQNTGAITKTLSPSNAHPVGAFTIASADGHFLFNAGNGSVAVFSIDSQTGSLTPVPGTPTSAGGSAGPMAITSDGHFLYAANSTEGTLNIFAVSTTGTLTPVAGSPFTIDNGAQFLALTPDGEFLYIASDTQSNDNFAQTVKGYAVNPGAGEFASISGAVVNNATSVTVDLSGEFAYISTFSSSTGAFNLVTYRIDDVTGTLTQKSQTNAVVTDDPTDIVAVP